MLDGLCIIGVLLVDLTTELLQAGKQLIIRFEALSYRILQLRWQRVPMVSDVLKLLLDAIRQALDLIASVKGTVLSRLIEVPLL